MKHAYVSTACHHEQHGKCRRACKFCGVSCACRCHTKPKPFTSNVIRLDTRRLKRKRRAE